MPMFTLFVAWLCLSVLQTCSTTKCQLDLARYVCQHYPASLRYCPLRIAVLGTNFIATYLWTNPPSTCFARFFFPVVDVTTTLLVCIARARYVFFCNLSIHRAFVIDPIPIILARDVDIRSNYARVQVPQQQVHFTIAEVSVAPMHVDFRIVVTVTPGTAHPTISCR